MNINLIITILVTVIGWIVLYFHAIRTNTLLKKKEITIKYFSDAWSSLEKGSNRRDKKYNIDIEVAIGQIQLFGTERQIELAQKLAFELSSNEECSTLELLNLLRDDLRKELMLKKSLRDLKFLRFN